MQMMIKPKLASAGIVVNTITWFLDVACGLFSYSFKYDFKTISKENAFERAKLIYLLNFNIYSSMISGFLQISAFKNNFLVSLRKFD